MTVKVWVRVPRHTNPLTHTNFSCVLRGGDLPGVGTNVTPSLNHAGCVITTSEVFFFSINTTLKNTRAILLVVCRLLPPTNHLIPTEKSLFLFLFSR